MPLDSFLNSVQDRLQMAWRQYLANSGWHAELKKLALPRVGQGKCLRPALIVKSYQSLSRSENLPPLSLWQTALALEMVHTYSLVHDDLPCMDDDNFRRGLPTAHREASEATALLLGDALLTGAFEVLAQVDLPAEIRVSLSRALARAAGGAGMVSGQQRDLHDAMASADDLKILHEEKTGELFAYCVWAAAQMALSRSEFLKHEEDFFRFGKKMGLLFQVVDDVLDEGEEGASFVKFMGVPETQRYATQLHRELKADADRIGLGGLNFIIDRFLERKT